jgi:putative ABC transport system permease protein
MLLNYLLRTDFGIAMRATGNNPIMTKSLGINNDIIKIIGLAIANALTGLSGFSLRNTRVLATLTWVSALSSQVWDLCLLQMRFAYG